MLVTGADTFWGGRVLRSLEADPTMEVLVGLGTRAPSMPLERAEFVRADETYSILRRIVDATQVDAVIHTFLLVDSSFASTRTLHEVNVIGTMNLLAACGDATSSVRQLVMKSSGLVYGSTERDPNTFSEETPRARPPRTDIERSLIEAEALVVDFAEENPQTAVSVLRCANVLGPDIVTSIGKNLSRPLCPVIFGFDPLVQFVEEGDVVRALEFATREHLAGTFNVAGDGRLAWSEVVSLCGSRRLPLPPILPSLPIAALVRLGVYGFPPELEALLRYGRGLETARLQAAGFEYCFTSAATVEQFARHLRQAKGAGRETTYVYEHDVEQFFRHSPAVVRRPSPVGPSRGDATAGRRSRYPTDTSRAVRRPH